jgi:hypothetical protein
MRVIEELACGKIPVPIAYQDNALKLINQVIKPLRTYFHFAILINSGYRTERHNKNVGGAEDSQHLTASAVDLDAGANNREMLRYLKKRLVAMGIDQLIAEKVDTRGNPRWVHVSIAKHPRNQILKT